MKHKADKPIRLLHLPKTAGTSVASGLLRVYGRKNRFVFSTNPSENIAKFNALSHHERSSIRTFIGHSLYSTGIPEADAARIITFLREPVSRVKSFINYVAAGRTSVVVDHSAVFDIDAFLESGNPELSNLQTKIFINKDRLDSDSGIRNLGADAAINLAQKRLFEGVTAFGLQDRFDEGWVAIWEALGVRAPLYAEMNARPDTQRMQFSDEQVARIRELNDLDIRLYEAAVEEFERRIDSAFPPRQLIEEFRQRQARGGARYTRSWNFLRNSYYACRRVKRRILGQPIGRFRNGKS